MQSNYIHWFDIEVKHNYFENLGFADFELLPFNSTAKDFKNFSIMQTQNENRISFYISLKGESIIEHIQGLETLQFQFLNYDPLFFNYTNLPFVEGDLFYHFYNQTNDNLHPKSFASQSEMVSHYKKKFNLNMLPSESNIEIKTSQGIAVYTSNCQGVENFQLNLSGIEDGLYQLWIDGNLKQTFFTSNEEIHIESIGIFSIDIAQLMSNYSAPKTLTLHFDARSAYFSYQVVVPPSRKIEIKEMSISSAEGETFLGPEEQTIIGNQTANVFTSRTSYQLRHKANNPSQLAVTYANNFSNRNNQLERNLPYPEIERLKKYNTGNGQENYLLTTIIYV